MAERITVFLKCCCGSEINVNADEYKRTWMDARLDAWANAHSDCPKWMREQKANPTPIQPLFQPGIYATMDAAGNVPIPSCFSGKISEADPT
jgi:hypothetical protein